MSYLESLWMERRSITMEQPQSQWNSFNLSGTVTIALEQSRWNSNSYGTVTVGTSTTTLEQSCVTVPAHILSMFQRFVTDPGFSPLWEWSGVGSYTDSSVTDLLYRFGFLPSHSFKYIVYRRWLVHWLFSHWSIIQVWVLSYPLIQ